MSNHKDRDAILLAELIHHKTCNFNHIDGCGWLYESWDDPEKRNITRNKYLKMAQKILKKVSYDDAVLVISCLD